MYIIGIDIGKNHHEASIVSPEGKQIGHSLRFATTLQIPAHPTTHSAKN